MDRYRSNERRSPQSKYLRDSDLEFLISLIRIISLTQRSEATKLRLFKHFISTTLHRYSSTFICSSFVKLWNFLAIPFHQTQYSKMELCDGNWPTGIMPTRHRSSTCTRIAKKSNLTVVRVTHNSNPIFNSIRNEFQLDWIEIRS